MCEAFIFGILLFAVFKVANPDEKKKKTHLSHAENDHNLAAAESLL